MKNPKDLISLSPQNWDAEKIYKILDLALELKKNPSSFAKALEGETLIMLFQKSSTRTRISFEAGMTQLGGHAIYLDWERSNFRLSKIHYEAKCLGQNASALMARLKKHENLKELCEGAQVPVINGCCNRYHPCQILADLLTLHEDRGKIEGTRLTYIGVHNNIANTLVEAAQSLDIELSLVCLLSPEDILDQKAKEGLQKRGLLKESLDPKTAVKNAEYVYTDTWLDLEFFGHPEHSALQEERIAKMLPYQVNEGLLEGSHAKVLHDMPIHLNYEITAQVVEGERSLIFKQSANRIHVQKALLLYLLNKIPFNTKTKT